MGNTTQLIVTCRFPSWGGENNDQYPAYGVKYLIEIPNEAVENGEEEKYFIAKYEGKIDKVFNGDILFIEEVQLVNI